MSYDADRRTVMERVDALLRHDCCLVPPNFKEGVMKIINVPYCWTYKREGSWCECPYAMFEELSEGQVIICDHVDGNGGGSLEKDTIPNWCPLQDK
jgi:hypothetical protein